MPTATFARAAARPLFQSAAFNAQARAAFRQGAFRPRFSQRPAGGRRYQSGTADAGAQASWFRRMWDSPIGLKTVHFW